ncbi:MAG TPA: isoaspartyl peptidase/L-asparaginase [Flavisolibacter sp.]|jgi:beta-aspartyl-peptidase (threonine type)
MKKLVMVVHGGAGPDSEFIRQHTKEYEEGIAAAVEAGYKVLEEGGSAVDAVEASVNALEDNPYFNAGKGSAINAKAEVEMCASIMQGKDRKSGAVAILKNVRNPISLARAVMEKTRHIYLGGVGALDFAKTVKAPLEPESYFITDHQYEAYEEKRKELKKEVQDGQLIALEQINERMHGTIGAVALDSKGNIAAATSTGGTECAKEGRIADSSMVGVGTYADNATCAVSTTGDGEYHIQHVSAYQIASLVEYKGESVPAACRYLIHEKCKDVEGDMGLIAVDTKGDFALEFNSDRMHRGWRTSEDALTVKIYKD